MSIINSVLSAILFYWMSFYMFPKWVSGRINKLRKNFFWTGEQEYKEGANLVAWVEICKSKK